MEISVDYYCNGGGGAMADFLLSSGVLMDGEGPVVKVQKWAAPFLPAAFITNNAFALQSILGGKRISIVILLQAWVWPGFKPQPCNAIAEWSLDKVLKFCKHQLSNLQQEDIIIPQVDLEGWPHTESARWVSSDSGTQNIHVHAPHL